MGGLVAVYAALRLQSSCSGLVLNSPLINVEWNAVMRVQASMAGLLARIAPMAKIVPAAKPEDMSQDPLVVITALPWAMHVAYTLKQTAYSRVSHPRMVNNSGEIHS